MDLNAIDLALSDGLSPSEGNPQFHQQMVYAVAMQTIGAFEAALGRKALWAGTSSFTQRLRIHPHALRDENAYYSPDKGALLFGYFPARSRVGAMTPPGTMVFTCLSSDVIAHETTHALLDGIAPDLRDPSNKDVLAFHEGFADIVALFQQFTYREIVARELAETRGNLSAAGLLGRLAQQFGEGTGKSGPLRSYPQLPRGFTYEQLESVHDLGSLLVAAVYTAFLSIVEGRIASLVRLATNGTGVQSGGHLHPDLVDAMTKEVCTAAGHVQRMAIRALDYLPPCDMSFGSFLRAMVTADLDAWPVDERGYRIALLQAFRGFGLLPRGLRTMSAETLAWEPAADGRPGWLEDLVRDLDFRPGYSRSRREIHRLAWDRKKTFQRHLEKALAADPAWWSRLGLDPALPTFTPRFRPGRAVGPSFWVDGVRIKRREAGEGTSREIPAFDIIARVRQRRPGYPPDADPADQFWFRGGSTLIIDPFGPGKRPVIRYVLRKDIGNEARLERERAYREARTRGDMGFQYFGGSREGNFAEPFAMLHAERHGGEEAQ